jgi:ankyrin repeat protein
LGLTILHTAVIANDIPIAKALINRKVNLDVKTSSLNNSGLTALHIAVQS